MLIRSDIYLLGTQYYKLGDLLLISPTAHYELIEEARNSRRPYESFIESWIRLESEVLPVIEASLDNWEEVEPPTQRNNMPWGMLGDSYSLILGRDLNQSQAANNAAEQNSQNAMSQHSQAAAMQNQQMQQGAFHQEAMQQMQQGTNQMIQEIQTDMLLMGQGQMLVQEPNHNVVIQNCNDVGCIVEYTGSPPQTYASSQNQIAMLRELYSAERMQDLVYRQNPFMSMSEKPKKSKKVEKKNVEWFLTIENTIDRWEPGDHDVQNLLSTCISNRDLFIENLTLDRYMNTFTKLGALAEEIL
jgi:hypothetical protein